MFEHHGRDERRGGTALIDRPATRTKGSSVSDRVNANRRAASLLMLSRTSVMGEDIEAAVEPLHDPLYQRVAIKLGREGDAVVNRTELEWEVGADWPGPAVAILVHDKDGRAIGRYDFPNPIEMPEGKTVTVAEGKARFKAIERE